MPLSSYYKIKYAVLKQLFDDMEAGKRTSREMTSPERFKINESYWLDIISSLSNNGYVPGLTIFKYTLGKKVNIPNYYMDLEILDEESYNNLGNYERYSDDALNRFIQKAAEDGVDIEKI